MKTDLRLAIPLAVFLFFRPAPASAEKIHLTSGTVITAAVTQRDKDNLWIKDKSGFVGLPLASIASIEDDSGGASRFDYPAYCARIKDAILKKDYSGASILCSNLIELFPSNIELRTLRASLNEKAGNTVEARKDYAYLFSVNAADAGVLNNLGAAYAKQMDTEQAKHFLQLAASRDPSLAAAHHNLAELYLRSKDWSGAAREYELVLAAEPANEQAQYNLGIAYMRLGEYAKASVQWRQVLASHNDEDSARALAAVKALSEGTK